ncbi:hypothetical protein COLO4_08188 [Corchorus olitorius]|uniref:AAA+ ATPase domain-containing protein n=1 Tax=Corchorus olitorius TaxID=93759 RepID=A0A1R3KGX0_9ROSI|nr:hypothetical protein COLO4_08188 [Corchorus olitorius]
MEVPGAIAGSLAGKVADYTVAPIARQVGYLFNYKGKCEKLKAQLEKLEAATQKVQQHVDEANRNGENIFEYVDTWLTKVNAKISAEQLVEDEEMVKKRCFAGLCPNFKSRYQLCKKAMEEADSIAELLEEEGRFDRLSYRHAPEWMRMAMRPVKDYEEFESRRDAFDGVMEALKDANLSMIGVYGMGGVGKTTLVKQVASKAKEDNLFDAVVIAALTQTPNILNVQNEIAEKLGLELYEASMDVRAGRLRDRLEKEKNVLIILDDIWVNLDLDALGVPLGDQHMGCKILMTSRKLDLLQSMGSQKNLAIEILAKGEAWNLFKNIAGDIVETSNIQSTAIAIANKCAGLPIAIATVAKALKRKEESYHWDDALEKLNKPSEMNFTDIPGDVYAAIELSYKFLETREVQPTFLLCSIMGHNAAIEDLLKYCRGFGLFRDLDTIQKAALTVPYKNCSKR